MKISEFWLRSAVDLKDVTRAQLIHKLTQAGLEVEGCEAVAPMFDHVLIGQITSCEKHPAADRLRVCMVDVGAAAPLQIVCGAPNARVGLKAPLAMIGAELPGGLKI